MATFSRAAARPNLKGGQPGSTFAPSTLPLGPVLQTHGAAATAAPYAPVRRTASTIGSAGGSTGSSAATVPVLAAHGTAAAAPHPPVPRAAVPRSTQNAPQGFSLKLGPRPAVAGSPTLRGRASVPGSPAPVGAAAAAPAGPSGEASRPEFGRASAPAGRRSSPPRHSSPATVPAAKAEVSPRKSSAEQACMRVRAELQQVLGEHFAKLPSDAAEKLIDWKIRGATSLGVHSRAPAPAASASGRVSLPGGGSPAGSPGRVASASPETRTRRSPLGAGTAGDSPLKAESPARRAEAGGEAVATNGGPVMQDASQLANINRSLQNITKADIQELKGLKFPPSAVKLTFETICILFRIKPVKKNDPLSSSKKVDDYWAAAQATLFLDANKFMQDLMMFDKDNIPAAVIKKLEPYIKSEEFDPDNILKSSKACKGLCQWVRGLYQYHQLLSSVRSQPAATSEQTSRGSDQAAVPVDDAVATFELSVRMVSGEVLMKMKGADLMLTRGDIIPHLRQLAPLPPTHVYELHVSEDEGKAGPVLSGTQTLADCGAVYPPGGDMTVFASLAENHSLPPLLEAKDKVLGLQDSTEFSEFVRAYPSEKSGRTVGTLCELWDIQPSCEIEVARNLIESDGGSMFFALVSDFNANIDPERTQAVLSPYCQDPKFLPSQVHDAGAAGCRAISEFVHALFNYSASIS